jgi:hypothetical protein
VFIGGNWTIHNHVQNISDISAKTTELCRNITTYKNVQFSVVNISREIVSIGMEANENSSKLSSQAK